MSTNFLDASAKVLEKSNRPIEHQAKLRLTSCLNYDHIQREETPDSWLGEPHINVWQEELHLRK